MRRPPLAFVIYIYKKRVTHSLESTGTDSKWTWSRKIDLWKHVNVLFLLLLQKLLYNDWLDVVPALLLKNDSHYREKNICSPCSLLLQNPDMQFHAIFTAMISFHVYEIRKIQFLKSRKHCAFFLFWLKTDQISHGYYVIRLNKGNHTGLLQPNTSLLAQLLTHKPPT